MCRFRLLYMRDRQHDNVESVPSYLIIRRVLVFLGADQSICVDRPCQAPVLRRSFRIHALLERDTEMTVQNPDLLPSSHIAWFRSVCVSEALGRIVGRTLQFLQNPANEHPVVDLPPSFREFGAVLHPSDGDDSLRRPQFVANRRRADAGALL